MKECDINDRVNQLEVEVDELTKLVDSLSNLVLKNVKHLAKINGIIEKQIQINKNLIKR
jgi:uncharacterized protein with PhoU and TrkA domain